MDLLKTSVAEGLSLLEFWRSLLILVCGSLFIASCSMAEVCDEIMRQSSMSALQVFLPSKIQIHSECSDLRHNITDMCSIACNKAILDFLEKNGDEEGKEFFKCVCTIDSNIYPLEECDIDRDRLRACPALYFLLETTSTTTVNNTATSTATTTVSLVPTPKIHSTKTAPPSRPVSLPGKDCRRARLDCQIVLECAKAFDYVKDKCLHDFTTNDKCSKSCSQAVGYVDMHHSSEDLWGCACDPESDEITWCGMYGQDHGLRKTCVKYELDDHPSNGNQEDDPRGLGIQPAVANVMTIFIPILLLLLLLRVF